MFVRPWVPEAPPGCRSVRRARPETQTEMKILVLTKRQYMGKDLLDDRFGRFRELPLELAKLGHEVKGVCLSYRARREGTFTDGGAGQAARVSWHSINLGGLILPGLLRYYLAVKKIGRRFQPDIIWACSDALHAIWAVSLAKQLQTRCVVDLYDNFEAFGATRIPGILSFFKGALKNADGVTCISNPLAEHVSHSYRPKGSIRVLENAVRKDLFFPQDRNHCRRSLGLPENASLVGTAGALYPERGVTALFRGFEIVASEDKNIHLALAGPRSRIHGLPRGPQVHDLGVLPLEKVPLLFNALDVAVIYNRDSSFGRYCFPQKAYEIMACGTPFIAAAVGSMKSLLDGRPELLFDPESPGSCAEALRLQLKKPTPPDLEAPGWSDFAQRLESFFLQIVAAGAAVQVRGVVV